MKAAMAVVPGSWPSIPLAPMLTALRRKVIHPRAIAIAIMRKEYWCPRKERVS